MKIRLLGAALFHADEQTGMKKLIAPFGNFAYAPNTFVRLKLLLI
jgi:hypothetical protein